MANIIMSSIVKSSGIQEKHIGDILNRSTDNGGHNNPKMTCFFMFTIFDRKLTSDYPFIYSFFLYAGCQNSPGSNIYRIEHATIYFTHNLIHIISLNIITMYDRKRSKVELVYSNSGLFFLSLSLLRLYTQLQGIQ